jgi:hypothetical protein
MNLTPPRSIGVDAEGVARTEADHNMKCPGCGQWFDMRDLAQSSSTSTTAVRSKF